MYKKRLIPKGVNSAVFPMLLMERHLTVVGINTSKRQDVSINQAGSVGILAALSTPQLSALYISFPDGANRRGTLSTANIKGITA